MSDCMFIFYAVGIIFSLAVCREQLPKDIPTVLALLVTLLSCGFTFWMIVLAFAN